MLDSILYTEVQSLSWFQTSNIKYLSKTGFSLLKSISEVLNTIEKTKDSRKMKSSNIQKYQFDEGWTAKFNHSQTWEDYHHAAPYWTQQINELRDYWDKHKGFASCSNDFLIKSFNTVEFSLRHIKKARKEFEESRWRLPNSFASRYKQSLQNMHDALIEKRQKIVNSMLARLRIASLYGNIASDRKKNVDDILFYVTDHLSFLNITDKKSLNTVPPRASLKANHCIKFYNAVKQYGANDADKNRVDMYHWSKNLGTKAALLSWPNINKTNMSQSGLMLIVNNKNTKAKIAIPSFLKDFVPSKRQYPAWYYWQEHRILDFWEKRQSFLFKLHDLMSDDLDISDNSSILRLEKYQKLIQTELQNFNSEMNSIPFFAFDLKNMLREWKHQLNHLSSSTANHLKEATNQNHHKTFMENLKRSHPIPIPTSKKARLQESDIIIQKSMNRNNIRKNKILEDSQIILSKDNSHVLLRPS